MHEIGISTVLIFALVSVIFGRTYVLFYLPSFANEINKRINEFWVYPNQFNCKFLYIWNVDCSWWISATALQGMGTDNDMPIKSDPTFYYVKYTTRTNKKPITSGEQRSRQKAKMQLKWYLTPFKKLIRWSIYKNTICGVYAHTRRLVCVSPISILYGIFNMSLIWVTIWPWELGHRWAPVGDQHVPEKL